MPEAGAAEHGGLIVVGHRFRNRVHRPGAPSRKMSAAIGRASALRNES
jgi:hypothetical protein